MGGIFSKPKTPKVIPPPATPTQANSSVQLAGTTGPGNFSTFISSGGGQTGLKRKAAGAKTSLIGGG